MRLFEHDTQTESSFQVAPFDAANKSAHLAIERSHPSSQDSAAAPGYEHSSHLRSHRRSGILDVVQWHTRNLSILTEQQGDALAACVTLTDQVERRYRLQGSDCSEYW